MKKITFEITLNFTDEINDDHDIKQVTQNIKCALAYACDTFGISPEHSDIYVSKITVNEPFTGTTLFHEVNNGY
jgi:hypothetical protein